MGRPYYTKELTVVEAFVLRNKLSSLRNAVGNEAPVHVLDKQLREIIGDLSSEQPLDTNLKEFYYLQAIVEERKENYYESMLLFRSLVELDPCNLAFRRSLETEVSQVCTHFLEQADKGALKVDLVGAYPVLRELGHIPYRLLTHVCLAEVQKGLKAQAKEKMMHLVALNPFDTDYIGAAQKVAEALQDDSWSADLLRCMLRVRDEHPWDLELQITIESPTDQPAKVA